MFHNNPVLAQLKQQLNQNIPRIEGTVKRHEKGYGFLETDNKKSLFIPPQAMKKVMHGDRILATIGTKNNKEIAEPESLIKPFLSYFVGKVTLKNNSYFIQIDHPMIKEFIPAKIIKKFPSPLQQDDWVAGELKLHVLRDGRYEALILDFISSSTTPNAPWLVTLSRYHLPCYEPQITTELQREVDRSIRQDLTELPFFTIDGDTTEDMDDAIYIEELIDKQQLKLMVAIADPTAYIPIGSELDAIARERAFTIYLPGYNIPMLPRRLSDDLCSLKAMEKRPAIICTMLINHDGILLDNPHFTLGWITSKEKLTYNNVSDFIEQKTDWQPENNKIKPQLHLLHRFATVRSHYRSKTTIVANDRPDYRFKIDENGQPTDITIEPRRVANIMVEEAMIAANIALAQHNKQIHSGVFVTHEGFENKHLAQISTILADNNLHYTPEQLADFDTFCQLRLIINQLPDRYIDFRLRRYLSHALMSSTPSPHFGLGLTAYTTWTSPIRKYNDLLNHRILKQHLAGETSDTVNEALLEHITEQRKACRMAEREMLDWLYSLYLIPRRGQSFMSEIVDINRGGMKVRIIAIGATAFIPVSFIHPCKEEITCQPDTGRILISNERKYQLADQITVIIKDIRSDNRNIIACIEGKEIN